MQDNLVKEMETSHRKDLIGGKCRHVEQFYTILTVINKSASIL